MSSSVEFSLVDKRAVESTETVESSVLEETRVVLRLILERKNRWMVSTNGEEAQTVAVRSDSKVETEQDFKFICLLSRQRLNQYVLETLSYMDIHPNICQNLQNDISSFARDSARKAWMTRCNRLEVTVEIEIVTENQFFEVGESEEEDFDSVLRESMDDAHHRGFGAVPAIRSSVDALETHMFNGGEGDSGEATYCVICFEEFSRGREVTCMPCSHVFHNGCIVSWLQHSNLCPLCRFQMPI